MTTGGTYLQESNLAGSHLTGSHLTGTGGQYID
jgi:hypothetical protein